ncbi:zf-HC2 domain-containing protein [Streptomyces sp. CC210A]|uniref:zf-HC2 domain-containing protein n=1 Tax=Streptomyces sp. CC210A TaxID=2898184 RepID=UPI001F1DC47E|nr:zf-HC2 domain-containing protein [Streptomyces sp. CC210A]
MKTLPRRRTPGIWSECREKLRHVRLRRSVGPYADGELTGAARARVAAHISRCWVCSGTLQTLRLVKSSLRRGPQRAPASLAAARLHRYAHRLAGSAPESPADGGTAAPGGNRPPPDRPPAP